MCAHSLQYFHTYYGNLTDNIVTHKLKPSLLFSLFDTNYLEFACVR